MAIELEEVSKLYGNLPVVHRVSLTVAEGELLVLLGASGSGKSTLLRMIAGLTPASEGHIRFAGVDVTALPPQRRDVGFVFQSYALFRHLTVAENVEFPLRIRGVDRRSRADRRNELLELVGLGGLADRLPRQLSGGQQQRVALARALAHRPRVLLLDEPFGALDARIRSELRGTIRAVQRELGVTTVFVTHDQEEAFELADRLAVLHLGRLLEVGPPAELYLHPRTELVASFLGTANLLVGHTTRRGVRLGEVEIPLESQSTLAPPPPRAADFDDPSGPGPAAGETPAPAPTASRVQVLFRPEDVALEASRENLGCPALGRATVESRVLVGPTERLRLRVELPGVRAIAPPVPFGADHILVEASRSQHHTWRFPLAAGATTWVGIRRLHALTHPGLSLVAIRSVGERTGGDRGADGRAGATPALSLAGDLARLTQARLAVLLAGPAAALGDAGAEPARSRLPGSGARIEVTRNPGELTTATAAVLADRAADLTLIDGPAEQAVERVESVLLAGDTHVLWVPVDAAANDSGWLGGRPAETPGGAVPTNALICVAVGEPGKEDVAFAGRLLRHLGARATVFTVLAPHAPPTAGEQAQRFLDAGVRTLRRLGITAAGELAVGVPATQIAGRLVDGGHDLLVVGVPLPDDEGRPRLHGVAGRLLRDSRHPVLLVRTGGPRP